MRHLIIASSLALLLAGCATQSPRQAAAPTGSADNGPFISRSAVFFPDTAPGFELAAKYKYPDVHEGIQITYRSQDLPAAKLDFFVYVLGRGPEDEAVARGMQDIRQGVDAAQSAGMYKDVKYGDAAAIDAGSGDGRTLHGMKLPLSFIVTKDGGRFLSVGYMFYKQLYLVELRISAPDASGAAVEKVGDQAVATLLPLIRVVSAGACADLTVGVSSQDLQSPNGLLDAVKRASADAAKDNCPNKHLSDADSSPKPGEHVEMLEYSLSDWQ